MKKSALIMAGLLLAETCTIIHMYTHPKTLIQHEINEVEVPVYIKSEKIVEVEVEKIIEVDKIVEITPAQKYQFTSAEREMLARLVYREANIEGIECQKAVASVVINRLNTGIWGDTLEEVIYYPYQFSPAYLICETTPNETNYKAVDEVLKNGVTIPPYVLYFRANYGFSTTIQGYTEYAQMDHTFFGYVNTDKIKYEGVINE